MCLKLNCAFNKLLYKLFSCVSFCVWLFPGVPGPYSYYVSSAPTTSSVPATVSTATAPINVAPAEPTSANPGAPAPHPAPQAQAAGERC